MSDSSKCCVVWLNVSVRAPDEWTNCMQAPSPISALEMSSNCLPWKLKWHTLLAKADGLCTGRMKAGHSDLQSSCLPSAQPVRTPTHPLQKTGAEAHWKHSWANKNVPITLFSLKNTELLLDINWEETTLTPDSYSLLKEARTRKLWQYLFLLIAVNEQ